MVAAASEEVSAALAHHVVPYDYLVEKLRPARSPRSEPFFQTMFSMRPEPSAWTLGDIEAELQPAHTGTSKRDLTMLLLESTAGVRGEIEYDTDLFDAATVARMAGHFVTLLDNYLAEPDRASGEVTMVSDTELAALSALNDTTLAVPDQRIEQAFEDQARRTPDAIAVRDDHRTLMFRELDERADALAERLARIGVGRGTYVGLRLERSVDMVIGILAILKCGAAYVPIDPHDPTGRATSVLADAGAVVVVSSTGSDDLPGITTVRVEDHPRPAGSRPDPAGQTGDAAYVLYTSGSTGLPKGVVVEHRQLLSYVHAALERFAIDGPRRYLMLQPLTVDSSATMLFPPLLTGGELHLVGRERALDAGALADYIQRYAIDCLKIAPSHLRALQASPRFAELLPRRLLVVGGEPSDWRWLVGVQRSAPYCEVFNHYGPTETTVGVLTFRVSGLEDSDFTVTPIGTPLPGTRAWVLDDDGRVLPPGVPGELHVGGANVARGYLHRPGATAAAFVPDPFCGVGARLYRTGDIARLRTDGSFEFRGRRDAQVKIHGFRIELGEIDAVLAGHPDVAHAITVVREHAGGERRIVSYAVAGRSGLDVDQLDRYLRDRLPGHVVPSSVMLLAELPRTPHGKIDQSALPAPRPSRGTARPPRNDLEHRIGAVWQRLLGVEQIDVDQNFFELGGSSLLIIRLHQELQKELGREFHLVELFSATTVRDQARQLGDGRALNLDRGRERGRKQAEILKRRTDSRGPGHGNHD
jgi:amino acid adenylation domain-containing protein